MKPLTLEQRLERLYDPEFGLNNFSIVQIIGQRQKLAPNRVELTLKNVAKELHRTLIFDEHSFDYDQWYKVELERLSLNKDFEKMDNRFFNHEEQTIVTAYKEVE